jgi:hypothetical protein
MAPQSTGAGSGQRLASIQAADLQLAVVQMPD